MRPFALACVLVLPGLTWAHPLEAEEEEQERLSREREAELELSRGAAAEDSGDRVGRVAAELGAALLGAALPNLLWLPFLAGGSTGSAGPVMLVLAAALEPVSITTSTWLVHRKMGGRGLWPAAFGGTMLGAALGGGLFALYGVTTGFRLPAHYTVIAAGGAILVCVAASVLLIEVHHDQKLQAAIAPLPGGAMALVGVRL